MVHDLDFHRVRHHRPSQPADTKAPKKKRRLNLQMSWPRFNFSMTIISIGIILVIGLVGYFFIKPHQTVSSTNLQLPPSPTPLVGGSPTPTATPQSAPIDAQNNIFSDLGQSFKVQIYNSGAGSDKVQEIANKLKEKGYDYELLGDSQAQYQTTDIWYQNIYETKALEIAGILKDRKVNLKESKISTVFDVLIFLGKN